MGPCKRIIGLNLEWGGWSIQVHQEPFIDELLTQYQLDHAETTPMNCAVELVCSKREHDNCELVDSTQYRELVGKLLYLAGFSRPDIAHTISRLSQFNSCPHQHHMAAARRVLKYLKGTKEIRITYKKTERQLHAFIDADWANSIIDGRSYTGYVVLAQSHGNQRSNPPWH